MARYHQHLADQLDFELTPLEFMQSEFPEEFKDIELARSAVGRYGISGKQQVRPNSWSLIIFISFQVALFLFRTCLTSVC